MPSISSVVPRATAPLPPIEVELWQRYKPFPAFVAIRLPASYRDSAGSNADILSPRHQLLYQLQ